MIDEQKFYQKYPKLEISDNAILGIMTAFMSDLDILDFQRDVNGIINDAFSECFKRNVPSGSVVETLRAGFGGGSGVKLYYREYVNKGEDSGDNTCWGNDYFVFEQYWGEWEPIDQLPRTCRKHFLCSPEDLWAAIRVIQIRKLKGDDDAEI